MNRLNRLINLYSQLGLNTDVGTFNRAEICGYCAGMDMLDSLTSASIEEKYVSKNSDFSTSNYIANLQEVAGDIEVDGLDIMLKSADIDGVGAFVNNWCVFFANVYLDGNGMSWQGYNKSWRELDNRLLRWSMIDTIGGI